MGVPCSLSDLMSAQNCRRASGPKPVVSSLRSFVDCRTIPIFDRHFGPASWGSSPSTNTSRGTVAVSLKDFNRRTLARAVGTEKSEYLSVHNVEIQTVDRIVLTRLGLISFD